jgi:hypothetical protein
MRLCRIIQFCLILNLHGCKNLFALIAGTEYFEGNEKSLLNKFMELVFRHMNNKIELIV